MILRAPFPWFGGKRRVADVVWRAFGDVPNYVEPFFGSGAVLLARPGGAGKVETVNDADCFLANFWRAVQAAPADVAAWADWPVNEADLHARHLWLMQQDAFRERMKTDPDHYDAKVAGWWVWGLSASIGSHWCRRVYDQLPNLGGTGRGVHRLLNGRAAGEDAPPFRSVADWLAALGKRLRRVRVACGDWTRVVSPAVLDADRGAPCGVFLDPPYDDGNMEYAAGGAGVSSAVRAWALEHGDDPRLRIALCGYEGEHDMPGWTVHAWKAHGGYANQSEGENQNARRERIWFSPHCRGGERQLGLLEGA